jgi:hypothetical protein
VSIRCFARDVVQRPVAQDCRILQSSIPRFIRALLLAFPLAIPIATSAAVTLDRSHLRPAEEVRVRWDALPAGATELELLLVREDAPLDVVRLTPQLDRDVRSFLWCVPDLPSQRARIEIRAGINEKELVVERSASFSIQGRGGEPEVRYQQGEWWSGALTPHAATSPDENRWAEPFSDPISQFLATAVGRAGVTAVARPTRSTVRIHLLMQAGKAGVYGFARPADPPLRN